MNTRTSLLCTILIFVTALLTSTIALAECLEPTWEATQTYQRDDRVTYADHEWRAKRTTTNVIPGTHKPSWADLGICADPDDPGNPPPTVVTPIQVFGVWHAGNHYADWALPREMVDFDHANHWIINRDAGSSQGAPSVNLVVLSFLDPMEVLNGTDTGAEPQQFGVPVGMTQEIVDYFKNAGIRVMMSIGGVTYVDLWDQALAEDAWQLGLNAAAIAAHFGVGIEIDYEQNSNPDLAGLQMFIDAYRSVHPYDATGANHAARLTIDLAAGGRYLQDLNRYATENWLTTDTLVLDYANAMVARSSGTPDNWQEHVNGMPTYNPVIPPKAPAKFTGGLYLTGNMVNCNNFYSSEQFQHADYVTTVVPSGAGTTPGMLGYMFWAAEYPSARKNYSATVPPNTCELGMGVAATIFDFAIPMDMLRQD
jgi:hypothetical protein